MRSIVHVARRLLLWCYLAIGLACTCAHQSAIGQDCIPLEQGLGPPLRSVKGPNSRVPIGVEIDKPGHYCLVEDLHIEGHYLPLTPDGDKLLSDDTLILLLSADDITLDFKGHSATSDAALDAGVMTPRSRSSSGTVKVLPKVIPKNLTLRNGSIQVSRYGMAVEVFGIGPQEMLVNIVKDATEKEYAQTFPWRSREHPDRFDSEHMEKWIGHRNRERAALGASFMPDAAAYLVRNLHIENMRLRSKEYAVVLQGAGSVIRDSVIETDSGTALWIYGPNAVIENNTIIVHCLTIPMSYRTGAAYCDDMDGPIRLQHGDGAVIRNNHFILRDQAKPRVLSLFDTGSITFEGNTFTGLDDPEKAIEVFRGPRNITTKVPNQSDNSPAALLKAWFK